MWWILKENYNVEIELPTTIITESQLILKMNKLNEFYQCKKSDIKNYFIQQGTTNVSAGILANLVFSFFATMRPNDYLVIPHKNIIKCVQIQENTFECSSTTWSWGINEIITIEREHIPEEINKYIRTPRILITVDNESTFYNFFIAEASVNKNSFDIPLDLNNANRKATITIPSDISSSEKERLKKLLELYL